MGTPWAGPLAPAPVWPHPWPFNLTPAHIPSDSTISLPLSPGPQLPNLAPSPQSAPTPLPPI